MSSIYSNFHNYIFFPPSIENFFFFFLEVSFECSYFDMIAQRKYSIFFFLQVFLFHLIECRKVSFIFSYIDIGFLVGGNFHFLFTGFACQFHCSFLLRLVYGISLVCVGGFPFKEFWVFSFTSPILSSFFLFFKLMPMLFLFSRLYFRFSSAFYQKSLHRGWK